MEGDDDALPAVGLGISKQQHLNILEAFRSRNSSAGTDKASTLTSGGNGVSRVEQRALCKRLAMPREQSRTTAILGALASELPSKADMNIKKVRWGRRAAVKKMPIESDTIVDDLPMQQTTLNGRTQEKNSFRVGTLKKASGEKEAALRVCKVRDKIRASQRVYDNFKSHGGFFGSEYEERWTPGTYVDAVRQRESCEQLARPKLQNRREVAKHPTKPSNAGLAAHRFLCERLAKSSKRPAWQRPPSDCSDSEDGLDDTPAAVSFVSEHIINSKQPGTDAAEKTPGQTSAQGTAQSLVASPGQQAMYRSEAAAHVKHAAAPEQAPGRRPATSEAVGKSGAPGTKGWMLAWPGTAETSEVQQAPTPTSDLILGMGTSRGISRASSTSSSTFIRRMHGLFAWQLAKVDAPPPDLLSEVE